MDDRTDTFSRLAPPAVEYRCRWCGATIAGDDVRAQVVDMFWATHGDRCRVAQERIDAAFPRCVPPTKSAKPR